MPNFVHITSADEPAITHYRKLIDPERQALEHRGAATHFIAEGQLVAELLIDSEFELHSLLMTPDRAELMAPRLERIRAPIFLATSALMREIAGFAFHRGVLGCGLRPAMGDRLARVHAARIIVALEGVSNPDNVGGILRSIAAIAGDAGALLLGPGCADPLYRKCVRVSMGHAFRVPWAAVEDLQAAVGELRRAGADVLATTPDAAAESVRALREAPGGRVVLLLGAEGPGLSPTMFQTANRRVRIPMMPGVDSLNVGVAAAIVLDRLIERMAGEPGGVSGVRHG